METERMIVQWLAASLVFLGAFLAGRSYEAGKLANEWAKISKEWSDIHKGWFDIKTAREKLRAHVD